MKNIFLVLIALTLKPMLSSADAIADLAVAKCVKCHTSDPDSQGRINGQHSDYILQTLKDYKNKVRQSTLMAKRVAALDEATMKGLSDYFSRLPVDPAISGDKSLIAAGKILFESPIPGTGLRTCAECHGKQGEGGGFGSGLNPRLASQLSGFTISQMDAYKTGTIGNQPEMSQLAQKLSAEQVKAIAEYVQSLP